MRMANDRDQAIVRAAAADAAANQLNFVPALGAGEVIAFGEGVALPIRLKFSQFREDLQIQSHTNQNIRPVFLLIPKFA